MGPLENNSFVKYDRKLYSLGVSFTRLNIVNKEEFSLHIGSFFEILPFDSMIKARAYRLSVFPQLNYQINNKLSFFSNPLLDCVFSGLKDGQALFYPLYINDEEDFSLSINLWYRNGNWL